MTLARYDLTAQDNAGNVVAGASVEVRREIPGAQLASLYSDREGTTPMTNPTTTDSNGAAGWFCVGGFYKITVTNGMDSSPPRRYVGIGLAQGTDAPAEGLVQRDATGGGTVTITNDDADIILVDGGSRVVYPPSDEATRPARTVDVKHDAAASPIHVVPARPHTVTISLASPGVVSLTAHGRSANDPVSLETTGVLPTGLAADTQYYVKTVLTPDTFTVSATPGGTAINTSVSQSGVHKLGTDTIMGAASYTIDGNGGSIKLTPRNDGKGWF